MFTSARLKLTAWYSLIIMLVAVSFSVSMYRIISSELDRIAFVEQQRFQRRFFDQSAAIPIPLINFDSDLLAEAKQRLIIILALIDTTILAGASASGYFLAGRTLRPIADMVDNQNRFISDSSHELRTPLTTLKSEIEVNLRDKGLTLAAAKQLLASNLEEVNNLQGLSDELIRLAQYQSSAQSLPMEPVSLADVVNLSLKKIAFPAGQKHIKIENNTSDCTLQGSQISLVEMLVIFLDNAVKYSPPGSTVRLSSQTSDRFLTLVISDRGQGIDPTDLPRLFSRFFRGTKSRTRTDTSGYGLGLSIAKQIIARHHGSVKVTSQPNLGTTFTIQLPL